MIANLSSYILLDVANSPQSKVSSHVIHLTSKRNCPEIISKHNEPYIITHMSIISAAKWPHSCSEHWPFLLLFLYCTARLRVYTQVSIALSCTKGFGSLKTDQRSTILTWFWNEHPNWCGNCVTDRGTGLADSTEKQELEKLKTCPGGGYKTKLSRKLGQLGSLWHLLCLWYPTLNQERSRAVWEYLRQILLANKLIHISRQSK